MESVEKYNCLENTRDDGVLWEKDIPSSEDSTNDVTLSSDQATGEDSSEGIAEDTDSQECLTKEGIQRLSHDLMDLFLPNLELAKESLHELTQNQKILIETVQQENAKFDECSSKEKLGEILSNAKKYHTKLLGIKKQMALLQEKSTKLKKRALRLQQQKQKEELQKAQQQEQDLEREQMLVAKVMTKQ